jgi:cytochrome P450
LGPLSLANRNGADHKARRRVVGQRFTSAALKRYGPSIVALVNDFSQELIASEAPLALVPKLRRFAFSVIASTVLGLDPADREALFVDFETWCQGLFSLPLALPGSPYARARQARQRLLRRLGSVLKTAQSAMESGAPLAAGLLAGAPLFPSQLSLQPHEHGGLGLELAAVKAAALASKFHGPDEPWPRSTILHTRLMKRISPP